MQTGQVVSLALGALLALSVLSGLIVRGLLSRAIGFAAYLLSISVSALLMVGWPKTFFRFEPWLAMEVTHAFLRHLVAVELAFHTFKAFPAARRRIRVFLWAMTIFALAAPFIVPAELFDRGGLRFGVLPRMLYAAVWLFTGLGALVLWYRLPLSRLHKAILMGFVPYLLVFNVLLNALGEFGLVHLDIVNFINAAAWMIVAGFWAWVVWQPRADPGPRLEP